MTDADKLVFKDPPAHMMNGQRRHRWQDFAEKIQEHPGRWVLYDAHLTETQCKNGKRRLRELGCLAQGGRSETTDDFELYAQWPA